MTSLAARLVACLKVMGVDPRANTVESRIVLQKLAYLIQASGVDLGIRFRWYLFGPYSKDLTRSIYDEGLVYEEIEMPRLTPQTVERLEKLRDFLGEFIEDTHYLELLASLHYARLACNEMGIPKNEVIEAFIKRKPHFTREEVEEAWVKLEEFEEIFGRAEIINGNAERKIDII